MGRLSEKDRAELEFTVLAGMWFFDSEEEKAKYEVIPEMFSVNNYRMFADIIKIDYGKYTKETAAKTKGLKPLIGLMEKWRETVIQTFDDFMFHYEELALESDIDINEQSGIYTTEDISEDIDRMYDNGENRGDSTGWVGLDQYYTVKKGEMTIVTGVPSSGKSEFLDALIINLLKHHKYKFAIFSPENFPIEGHFKKLAEKIVEKPFFGEGRMDKEELKYAKDVVDKFIRFIFPLESQMSIDGILRKVKQARKKFDIDGIVIDPWNEIEHNRPPHQPETEYISELLTRIRRFVREEEVFQWIVAHPTKISADRRGKYPVVTPYMISGSASWKNKADNCITVHRPDASNKVEIWLSKVRNKTTGRPGKATLYYNNVTGIYKEEE